MKRLFACTLLLFAAAPTFAADANGYTAKYEVRAGNTTDSTTNFDLAKAVALDCDQTITMNTTPTSDWSAINWSNNVICIQAGDHTGRGTLTLGSSGTSGIRKVLRYTRSGDTGDAPWNQTDGNQAKIADFKCFEKDYWIIHRLTFWQTSANNQFDNNGCQYMIYDHMLVDGRDLNPTAGRPLWLIKGVSPAYRSNDFTTVQNSVIRRSGKRSNSDQHCINAGAKDIRFVSNEIYDCGGDGIVMDNGSNPYRNIVENNDIYQTNNYLIACDGSAGTTCSCGEDGIDIKDNSNNSAALIQVLHNRIWGWRTTYSTCSGSGSYGYGVNSGGTDSTEYVLIKNNIIFSVANGINMRNTVSHHRSAIGNLLYDINHGHSPTDVPSHGDGDHSIALRYDGSASYGEAYLNSIIASKEGFVFSSSSQYQDIRCNVLIDVASTSKNSSDLGAGSAVDNNAFYGSTVYTLGGTGTNISKTISTRANSINYTSGTIVRTASLNGFLYKANNTGTSDSSSPTWCTVFGCKVVDNGVTWQAVRGPYSFYRKLKTLPEQYTIPYARAHTSAPEMGSCPSGFSSRAGIGIDDTQL